jgi:4-hydroxy-2-oxoglutarate aldolase
MLNVDIASFEAQVIRLANAGVGPLLAGSMGEAIHLSHEERIVLIKVARKALDDAGYDHVPIIAGTGAGSTRETIELCQAAAKAGADYTIVIASGYFAGLLAGNKKALKAFWTEIAAKSPIPVLVYNCDFVQLTLQSRYSIIFLLCRSWSQWWYRLGL